MDKLPSSTQIAAQSTTSLVTNSGTENTINHSSECPPVRRTRALTLTFSSPKLSSRPFNSAQSQHGNAGAPPTTPSWNNASSGQSTRAAQPRKRSTSTDIHTGRFQADNTNPLGSVRHLFTNLFQSKAKVELTASGVELTAAEWRSKVIFGPDKETIRESIKELIVQQTIKDLGPSIGKGVTEALRKALDNKLKAEATTGPANDRDNALGDLRYLLRDHVHILLEAMDGAKDERDATEALLNACDKRDPERKILKRDNNGKHPIISALVNEVIRAHNEVQFKALPHKLKMPLLGSFPGLIGNTTAVTGSLSLHDSAVKWVEIKKMLSDESTFKEFFEHCRKSIKDARTEDEVPLLLAANKTYWTDVQNKLRANGWSADADWLPPLNSIRLDLEIIEVAERRPSELRAYLIRKGALGNALISGAKYARVAVGDSEIHLDDMKLVDDWKVAYFQRLKSSLDGNWDWNDSLPLQSAVDTSVSEGKRSAATSVRTPTPLSRPHTPGWTVSAPSVGQRPIPSRTVSTPTYRANLTYGGGTPRIWPQVSGETGNGEGSST